MSGQNLLNKVWDRHLVRTLPSEQDQLFIGLHLIHEVTSPQAFGMLREKNLEVIHPERTFATADHIIPTDNQARPFEDPLAEAMMLELEKNCKDHNITFFHPDSGNQGIVHIVGPESGLTQPGLTIACGDSHTSTHGAFGSIAFGIGTSQVRDILATQTMALSRPKVRKILVTGILPAGVTAKDIILRIIRDLGVNGGLGYAYEYTGSTIEKLTMDERMTLCNMSIEGGARVGYINPDQVTYDYIQGRSMAPDDSSWDKAVEYWDSIRSDADALFDDEYFLDVATLEPMVTWGINPGQSVGISETLPALESLPAEEQEVAARAYDYMDFKPGDSMKGKKVDVVFIGSCTNGRLSDLREAARIAKGRKVASHVRALVVPGSQEIAREAEKEGLDAIFTAAGFLWRRAGCSMCLAMNSDKLKGRELSASTSNRNFIGRQGSPTGRTILLSPVMAVAAAVTGVLTDIRELEA